jgi:hypothetical protein
MQQRVPTGFQLAPIHADKDGSPIRLCLLVATDEKSPAGPFVLLRELPGARIYLGAVCDVEGRIHDWLEIGVQTLELRDLSFSNYQERLTNHAFDLRWRAEYEMNKNGLPDAVLVTGLEKRNPGPLLIKRPAKQAAADFLPVEATPWQICQDDALLASLGLPPYSTSPFRYLHDPAATGPKTLFATSADAPTGPQVQSVDQLFSAPDIRAVFNPHAGLIRVTRFHPLPLEEHVQVLEGRAWEGMVPGGARIIPGGVYAELQTWSASPKGIAFLLHGTGSLSDKLNETLFLKLALLRDMFKEVRNYAKAQQLPLLNLSPASFRVRLENSGDQFPALWSAKSVLVKPGQAHPLKIKATQQRYFIRLGRAEPSPFLPEGLGAHSFGIGSVRLRNVLAESDGTTIEGTLVAEDYLGLNAHDLLWFKLPLGEERLEFYAHVHTSETVGPKEARFRTVATKLSESLVASLKQASGSSFQKAPYEVWPLLSSPCDLYSLGIMAVRLLLANSQSNLPVIVDEILSLARHLGKEAGAKDELLPRLKALVEREPKLLDLISPHSLIERDWTPAQARAHICLDVWLDAICVLVRMFPGAGAYSYCKSFGDVSPLALETVFHPPIQELETLVARLRTILAPSLCANEEIAGVLLEQLSRG